MRPKSWHNLFLWSLLGKYFSSKSKGEPGANPMGFKTGTEKQSVGSAPPCRMCFSYTLRPLWLTRLNHLQPSTSSPIRFRTVSSRVRRNRIRLVLFRRTRDGFRLGSQTLARRETFKGFSSGTFSQASFHQKLLNALPCQSLTTFPVPRSILTSFSFLLTSHFVATAQEKNGVDCHDF